MLRLKTPLLIFAGTGPSWPRSGTTHTRSFYGLCLVMFCLASYHCSLRIRYLLLLLLLLKKQMKQIAFVRASEAKTPSSVSTLMSRQCLEHEGLHAAGLLCAL